MKEKGTFHAALSPEARVRKHLFVLSAGVIVIHAFGPADSTRVHPVVGAHRDGHQAEGRESPRRGEEHLHSTLTHLHPARGSLASVCTECVSHVCDRDSEVFEKFWHAFLTLCAFARKLREIIGGYFGGKSSF